MGLLSNYNPDKDIPDLDGRVFFITGGTAGIGKETILQLAKHNPARIHFTGRNQENGEKVIAQVKQFAPTTLVTYGVCDQTSLASVNDAVNSFLSEEPKPERLDTLICNAGVMGPPAGLTKDDYEIQFGINYLSHSLFTKLLLPLLERTASDHGEARIVNLTSVGYAMHSGGIPFDELKTTQDTKGYMGKWARYCQSKFATVLYTSELAKRHPSIMAVAIHPGVIHTNLVEGLPFLDRVFIKLTTLGKSIPLEKGAYNTLWAATTTDKEALESGGIYEPVGKALKRTEAASDENLWGELWKWTEDQLSAFG